MSGESAPELISKDRFVADIGNAVAVKVGYPGGKIGFSEQHWLNYPVFLATSRTTHQREERPPGAGGRNPRTARPSQRTGSVKDPSLRGGVVARLRATIGGLSVQPGVCA